MNAKHDHVLDFVDDYLHDVLSPDDAAAVEQHCQRCPICRAALEEARRRLDAVRSLPACEASGELVRRTLEHVEKIGPRRERLRKLVARAALLATAASILIIGGLHAYYALWLQPPPYDLRILGQARWLAGSFATVRVAVVDRRAGQPMPGVPVELSLVPRDGQAPIRLARFTTSGPDLRAPRFAVPDLPSGKYELRVTAQPPGRTESLARSVRIERQWRLMLSTDKPVYQPGQTIHVRALALRRPDRKPVVGQPVEFSISDPKGNIIFRRADVTSRFGIAAVDCPLADEILHGTYQIDCRVGQTTSTRSVKVEKYVLPKFRVTVQTDKPFYQPPEQVTVDVEARYFFGEPVAGADVDLQVFATDVAPQQLIRQRLRTDHSGHASFQFRLPDQLVGKPQHGGDTPFQIFATVTDPAGQSYSAAAKPLVTANPLRITVIPESGTLVRDVANRIYIFVSYADGRSAQARLIVSGEPDELLTSELGLATIERIPEGGSLQLTIKAIDTTHSHWVGQRTVRLDCGRLGDYIVRPDRAVYRGGSTMTLSAYGGGVEPVFVDLIQDGQSVLCDTIEMSDGRGQLQIDLPPDLAGTLQLVTYRFDWAGFAIRKSRVVLVQPADQLRVDVQPDAPEYRPGQTARLKFQLSDSSGRPVPGAISLSVVDEAVFSVLNQSGGVEEVFFLLERQLLKPVYAIYPWVPDWAAGRSSEPREQLDEALLAATVHTDDQHAVPGEFLGQFGSSAGPFTLAANSFRHELAEFRRTQRAGLRQVGRLWAALVAAWIAIACAVWIARRPKQALITLGSLAAAILLLPFLLLPAVQSAREAALRVMTEDEAALEFGAEMPAASAPGQGQAGPAPPRLREYFPETLLWLPELVTDENGRATWDLQLADSITSWRLSASAVAADGRLGSTRQAIRVFQPFFVELNLPVALTRGDEAAVPIVVYNYLDRPQTVEITVEPADWFAFVDAAQRERPPDDPSAEIAGEADGGEPHVLSLAFEPGQKVRSVSLPIRAVKVGRHQLQLTARSGDAADAVKRTIQVVPNGRPVEQLANGNLSQPVQLQWDVPQSAVLGSVTAIVKLHPSTFSQLVEGLDGIFRMPTGCFEQTSSATYPNVLALDYLRSTGQTNPAVEAKARQYIHLGYQRLLSFEVPGGGFDWYGQPPAKETLTAYGLMEFRDMARVHDVDPRLIERTRRWLLSRRNDDGSWPVGTRTFRAAERPGVPPNLAATAYIAWAVFGDGQSSPEAAATLDWLLRHPPQSLDDPYVLSLIILAIAGVDDRHPALADYRRRLIELKQQDDTGQRCWWTVPGDGQTVFYGRGPSGHVESTAIAVLALIDRPEHIAAVRGALNWLVEQKKRSRHVGLHAGDGVGSQGAAARHRKTAGRAQSPAYRASRQRPNAAADRRPGRSAGRAETIGRVQLPANGPESNCTARRERRRHRLSSAAPLLRRRPAAAAVAARAAVDPRGVRPQPVARRPNCHGDSDRHQQHDHAGPDGHARLADPARLRDPTRRSGLAATAGQNRPISDHAAASDRVPDGPAAGRNIAACLPAARHDAAEGDRAAGARVSVLRPGQPRGKSPRPAGSARAGTAGRVS